MREDAQIALYRARKLAREGFVTFDTETTGLDWGNQIISWAICSQDGTVLGSGYCRPTVEIEPGAYAVHGITAEQLAGEPTFDQVWPTIRELLGKGRIVIYNASFDLMMLRSSADPYGIEVPERELWEQSYCAMELYAKYHGDWHEYFESYTWQKLTTALHCLKIERPGEAHNAVNDARATALLINKMAELADQQLPAGWHPPVGVKCAGGCYQWKRFPHDEAGTVWYCDWCAVKAGLYHNCPGAGCRKTVKRPASGIGYEDLCESCLKLLHREEMLLTGRWHWCPGHGVPSYNYYHGWQCKSVVETEHPADMCRECQSTYDRYIEYEREKAERRRATQKAYRAKRREFELANRERVAQGLEVLEWPKRTPRTELVEDGHHFDVIRDERYGTYYHCRNCDAAWARPPRRECLRMKLYRGAQPDHLKTRTALQKAGLRPTPESKIVAWVERGHQFEYYPVYDERECVPIPSRAKREKAVLQE